MALVAEVGNYLTKTTNHAASRRKFKLEIDQKHYLQIYIILLVRHNIN